jgi:phosphoribosylformimino-5-aminoimidazole carboxamide ribotide isomerase
MVSTLQAHGLQQLHCVDLDGAFKEGNNRELIVSVINNATCPVQVGGGLHSMEAIDFYLNHGAHSVVLGSSAFTQPELLTEALQKYGDRIIVAMDVKEEKVMIHGWTVALEDSLESILNRLEAQGVRTILMSDVSHDGMLGGSNVSLYKKVTALTSMKIQASGGIRTRQDVLDLVPTQVVGVIVGKAFIHQTLDLDILGETL